MEQEQFHVRHVKARKENHAKNAREQERSRVVIVMDMEESLVVAVMAQGKRSAPYVTKAK